MVGEYYIEINAVHRCLRKLRPTKINETLFFPAEKPLFFFRVQWFTLYRYDMLPVLHHCGFVDHSLGPAQGKGKGHGIKLYYHKLFALWIKGLYHNICCATESMHIFITLF